MALTNSLFNIALDAMAGNVDSISLHQSNPDPSGTDEITGGTYARQTPSWGTASAASVGINANIVFDIPAGSTVAYVGMWDSAGPTWRGSVQLDNSESFSGDGTFTLTSLAITMSNA